MERIVRPLSRQLNRQRLRYPFAVPSSPPFLRLYSMGHTVPPVSDVWRGNMLQLG
jgi:succinate-semialdehyde dehydrogenase / glutarate-semialdehyde dehydrogenase